MDRRETTLTPESWTPRGEAWAMDGGRGIAIWEGIPGERAVVRVVHRGRNRAEGRWLAAEGAPHPRRVAPACSRYAACGGCALMHLDPAGQAAAREQLLRAALEAVGGDDVAVAPAVPAPEGLEDFRHVAKLAAGYSDRGHVRLGALGRNSADVIPIPRCLVVTPVLREAMKVVSHHVIELGVSPFLPARGEGLLRWVVLRQSRATGELLVTLVASRPHGLLEDLAETLREAFAPVAGVHLHVNRDPGNAIFRVGPDEGGFRRLSGRPVVEERVAGVRLLVGPGDFFQTHPAMAHRLYQDVAAHLPEDRPLLDLYCGVGGMTLVGARRTGWALGVEENPAAVSRARSSAALNDLPAEFVSGQVLDVLPGLARRLGGRRPVVVVNPARRGLEPGVGSAIVDLDPERVIYVSCAPPSLARDLAGFARAGWRLRSLVPYDMFPHTPHQEVVAMLEGPPRAEAPSARAPRRRRITRD